MGEAAALWGDIPYRSAFDYTENPDPSYDAQAQVLGDVQALLSQAIAKLGPDADVANVYGAPIFAANNANWAEVAYSLKARYFMIVKDYANAHANALLGISSEDANLMSSHRDEAGARSLYFQFLEVNRNGYLTAEASNLVKLMNGERARLLATPGDAERYNFYFGSGPQGVILNTAPGAMFAVDAGFPIISYTETILIEAEAASLLGLDALAIEPFNEFRAFLAAKYSADFPASTSSGMTLWKEIVEEKYVSMPGSLQIFHDTRRNSNVLAVPVKGSGNPSIPQRFFYPQVEINANDNFPGLVDLFEPTPVNK